MAQCTNNMLESCPPQVLTRGGSADLSFNDWDSRAAWLLLQVAGHKLQGPPRMPSLNIDPRARHTFWKWGWMGRQTFVDTTTVTPFPLQQRGEALQQKVDAQQSLKGLLHLLTFPQRNVRRLCTQNPERTLIAAFLNICKETTHRFSQDVDGFAHCGKSTP